MPKCSQAYDMQICIKSYLLSFCNGSFSVTQEQLHRRSGGRASCALAKTSCSDWRIASTAKPSWNSAVADGCDRSIILMFIGSEHFANAALTCLPSTLVIVITLLSSLPLAHHGTPHGLHSIITIHRGLPVTNVSTCGKRRGLLEEVEVQITAGGDQQDISSASKF